VTKFWGKQNCRRRDSELNAAPPPENVTPDPSITKPITARKPGSSLHSKRYCWVREQRITARKMERVKEVGGAGEGRKRLQTNPWILKTAHLAFHA